MNGSGPRQGLRLGAEPLCFTFDGREISGFMGDSAASALLASQVTLLGRSVKYHRPRGLLTAGPEEPNALLTVGAAPLLIPNVSAPQLAVREGLEIRSQNRWPTLRLDAAALLGLGGGFFAAGFYYKTFMWPSWRAYEGIIRRLAGLGFAPGASELGPADVEHFDCDVLIAGGGPAGLAAALCAARAGARVVVCEREIVCGGELEFETATIEHRPALIWVTDALRELHERSARVLTETAVVNGADGLVVAHCQPGGLPGRDRMYRIRARSFIVATGAIERPIVFIDNDRPGVLLLGAAERYLSRYGVRIGANLVLFGNHDRLYAAAVRFLAAGMRVVAIVDTRAETAATERVELQRVGVECLLGHAVLSAVGRMAVTGARIAPVTSSDAVRTLVCDALLVSGGWTAAEPIIPPVTSNEAEWRFSCGAASSHFELSRVLEDARVTGRRAARCVGETSPLFIASGDAEPQLVPFWRSAASRAAEKRQFVDFQNDVTVADLRQALAEGFDDIEHAKRYTTLGIGTEQGRTGGLLGAAILAELASAAPERVIASRARPPYQPVTMAALAGLRLGQALRPERRTPLYDWHVNHGGELETMGMWMRPRYYRANGTDTFSAGVAEAARVRDSGGILDASTLGKIEVAGADAAAFLDHMHVSRASTIKVGRGKYMVSLREDGMVLDDGIVLRLAENRYLATTSTHHASHILSHFEFWRDTEWAGHAVTLTDVTEAWAVIVVAGPRSREKLRTVLGAEWHEPLGSLSHMEFASGCWQGQEVRVLRASFSGELAFELHCRPGIAPALWQALVDAGLPPYGLEAVDILRIEKGYLVGAELNGQTTPQDLGMEGMLKVGNPCIGREMLDRPGLHEPDRPRLVGLRAVDGRGKFLPGAQITALDAPTRGCGHVTSAAYSPALGEWVGLALVSRRLAAPGSEVLAQDPLRNSALRVRVVPPVHLDPSGERMKA